MSQSHTRRVATSALILSLAILSAGLDLALGSAAGRGWTAGDLGLLWVLAVVGVLPFLLPAALVGRVFPERRAGLLLFSVVLLHSAVGLRFGPLVNAPLSSPQVLGSWLLLGLICGAAGWLSSPWIERWLSGRALVGIGLLGLLGLPVAGVRIASDPGVERAEAPADAPNIVLFTLDTTRRDFLSMYGREVDTPHLQALADRGAVFEDAVAAAPQTGPSHLSILTGQYPLTHGVVANGTHVGGQPLVSRVLQAAGWQTAGFVAAFPVHERFAFDAGFDVYDSDFSPMVGLHELAWVKAFDAVVFRNLPRERRGDAVNQRALRWLRRISDAQRPFFTWIHYYDPHGPYTPPGNFHELYTDGPEAGEPMPLPEYWPPDQRAITDAAYLTAQYDAEIAYTDALLGQVLAELERFQRDTILIVTADHGESLTEHGVYFDHGDDLYDTELRVPLIIAAPGRRPGVRVRCQTPSVDLVPTLLELAGVEDDGTSRDGISRAGELDGGRCTDRDAFASTVAERVLDPPVDHALRRPDWKFILTERGEDELYDLIEDAGEEVNLVAERSAEAGALRAVLQARQEGATELLEAEMSPEVVEMLRGLGYVDGEE